MSLLRVPPSVLLAGTIGLIAVGGGAAGYAVGSLAAPAAMAAPSAAFAPPVARVAAVADEGGSDRVIAGRGSVLPGAGHRAPSHAFAPVGSALYLFTGRPVIHAWSSSHRHT